MSQTGKFAVQLTPNQWKIDSNSTIASKSQARKSALHTALNGKQIHNSNNFFAREQFLTIFPQIFTKQEENLRQMQQFFPFPVCGYIILILANRKRKKLLACLRFSICFVKNCGKIVKNCSRAKKLLATKKLFGAFLLEFYGGAGVNRTSAFLAARFARGEKRAC